MTWQSLSDVFDRTTTNETDDVARYAPLRTTQRGHRSDLLTCPSCPELIQRPDLAAHFDANHAPEFSCPTRGCDYEAETTMQLVGHTRYRHRREAR